jgi:hypothetical protein
MRQFTIAERLMAATLLPLSAMLAVPYLTAALLSFLGEANAAYARIATGLPPSAWTGPLFWRLRAESRARWPRPPIRLIPSPMRNFSPPRHCRPAG